MDDLEIIGSVYFPEARPFEYFDVSLKNFYGMKSRRSPARVHETVKIMSSVLESVQRAESEVHRARLAQSN